MPPSERGARRSTVTTLACVCGLAATSLAAGAQPHDAATVPLALPGFAAHPPSPQRYQLPTDSQDDEPADIATSSIGARLTRLVSHTVNDAQPSHGIALDDGTIPQHVLDAYRQAADTLSRRDAACQLHWSVLAGIGRIESGHARGGALLSDGRTASPILGPRLDGSLAGTATIHDSTGGQFDGDTVWERAVGPMQFLPSTWLRYGQDGNDDGVRDPHNIYDATLGSAVYLCAGARDLSDASQLNQALFSYNPSLEYVRAVLAWADHYAGLGPRPGTGRPVTHTLAASRGPDEAATKPGKPERQPGKEPTQEQPKQTDSKAPKDSTGQDSDADNEERAGNTDDSSTPNPNEDTESPGPTDDSQSEPNDDASTENPESPAPAKPSEPAEPTEPPEPSDPAEPAEPSEPTEPTEPPEPDEPTEPTEPSDPTEPTEPSEPAEPTEPGETDDDPSCEQPDNTDDAGEGTDSEDHDNDTDADSGRPADRENSERPADGKNSDRPANGEDEKQPDDETSCERPEDNDEDADRGGDEHGPDEPSGTTEPTPATKPEPTPATKP